MPSGASFFRYEGGRQRALGEVRLDALTSFIRVDPGLPAGLRFTLKKGCLLYVSAISQGSPSKTIKLYGTGVVRWWWSSRQCHVTLDDQHSPPMCSANGGI